MAKQPTPSKFQTIATKWGLIIGFIAGLSGGATWAAVEYAADTVYRWLHPSEVRFASEIAPGLNDKVDIIDEEVEDLRDKYCLRFPEDC